MNKSFLYTSMKRWSLLHVIPNVMPGIFAVICDHEYRTKYKSNTLEIAEHSTNEVRTLGTSIDHPSIYHIYYRKKERKRGKKKRTSTLNLYPT